MLDEYMKKLEGVIDKDEYDRSNFEEKILKREELLKELNLENEEQIEPNPIDQKLIQAATIKKLKNNNKNIGNRPAWGSNKSNNKKNNTREAYKQSKVLNSKNINNKVEEKRKKKSKFKKRKRKSKAKAR